MTLVPLEIVDVDGPGPDDLRLHSVTSILKEIDKGEGLMWWACRKAAECALDNISYVVEKADVEGRAAAVDWIAKARYRPATDRLPDNDLGTVFHTSAEQYTISGVRPDRLEVAEIVHSLGGPDFTGEGIAAEARVVDLMLDRYDEWLARFQPRFIAAEYVVYSPTFGYAGTADGALVLPAQADADELACNFDYKTTRQSMTGGQRPKPKRPYGETVLQLVAYRRAEFAAGWTPRRYSYYSSRYYLLAPGERALAVPVPEVDGSLCILVTPDWCEAFPMRTDDDAWRAFLFALEIARWSRQTSKGAVGDPLQIPTKVSE